MDNSGTFWQIIFAIKTSRGDRVGDCEVFADKAQEAYDRRFGDEKEDWWPDEAA